MRAFFCGGTAAHPEAAADAPLGMAVTARPVRQKMFFIPCCLFPGAHWAEHHAQNIAPRTSCRPARQNIAPDRRCRELAECPCVGNDGPGRAKKNRRARLAGVARPERGAAVAAGLHAQLGEHVVNGGLRNAFLVRPFKVAAALLEVFDRLPGFFLKFLNILVRVFFRAVQHQA